MIRPEKVCHRVHMQSVYCLSDELCLCLRYSSVVNFRGHAGRKHQRQQRRKSAVQSIAKQRAFCDTGGDGTHVNRTLCKVQSEPDVTQTFTAIMIST